MGRNRTLLKGKPLQLTVNQATLDYLRDAVSTGLFGRTIPEAAERLISQGLQQLMRERAIGPIRHYSLDDESDSREDSD